MRYLLTALVLAAPLSSGAAPSNVCDVSDIIDCKALAKAPVDLSGTQGFPKFKDGRQIFNVVAAIQRLDSPEYIRSQEPTPKQLKDLVKNADRLKKRVREFLKAGRSEEWVKSSKEPEAIELRAILKRLDSIQIRASNDDDYECTIENTTGGPNALSESIRNTILLCPPTAKQGLPWLTRTIAHEIGHALGPCAMERPLFKTNPDAEFSGANCLDEGENSENLGIDRDIKRLIKSIRSGEVTSLAVPSSRLNDVRSCLSVEEIPDASVPRENRKMFGRAPKCIESAHAAFYEEGIKRGIAQKMIEGATDAKRVEADLRSEFTPTCLPRADEHFADSFAARFTAYVAEEDNWNKNDIRISMMNDATAVCAAQANGIFLNPVKYPAETTRLSVAFNEAVIRDRLNCVVEPKADEKFCPLPSTPSSTQQRPAQRTGTKPSTSSPRIQ